MSRFHGFSCALRQKSNLEVKLRSCWLGSQEVVNLEVNLTPNVSYFFTARVFPRVTSVTCICFQIWLVLTVLRLTVLCDWLGWLLWFWYLLYDKKNKPSFTMTCHTYIRPSIMQACLSLVRSWLLVEYGVILSRKLISLSAGQVRERRTLPANHHYGKQTSLKILEGVMKAKTRKQTYCYYVIRKEKIKQKTDFCWRGTEGKMKQSVPV